LLLEEYGVTFKYLPGKESVTADALSFLDINELTIPQEEALSLLLESNNKKQKKGKGNLVMTLIDDILRRGCSSSTIFLYKGWNARLRAKNVEIN
jgi:hypothetical protein